MKAIGMPPSDPRIRQMNDAQWLWCYMNVIEDRNDEEKMWKTRLDYIGSYVDPERAKSVMESDALEESNQGKTVQKEGIYNNNDFEAEIKAASLGYEPSSGLTPTEFLKQYDANKKKDIDIMNDDFDTLLASGEFVNVTNADNSVGNSRESEADFLSRVSMMKEFADTSFENLGNNIQNEDAPIDPKEEDLQPFEETEFIMNDLLGNNTSENSDIYFDDNNIKNYNGEEITQNFDNMSPEEYKQMLEQYGLTEDDLDIIEVPDDDE